MATARCYTKSGSVEKYEPSLFSGGVNHYPHNFASNIIGPDSNGNYTITYNGYDDGTSDNYDCYCKTMYGDWRNGAGISKTFYFKESIREIWLHASIEYQEGLLVVYLAFDNNEYLGNDKLSVKVEITADNPTALIDSVFFTVDKNSKPLLSERIYKYINMNRRYSAKVVSCSPMSGSNYRVTIDN